VAVCGALPDLDCAIKWPNDVWIERRKLAGILVEGRPQEGWAVLGIGLNVMSAPPDLPATCLREHDPQATTEGALTSVVAALEGSLSATRDELLSAWRERDVLHGELVRWDRGEGSAAGIDDSGALLVDTTDGRVSLDAGEVHLLRNDS
jgi:BirA family biotin operon repressor/biotin-[acetyl-CoA-carboxylase] ligase